MLKELPTPEEFKQLIVYLKELNKYDPSGFHQDADRLLCDLLKLLGYEDGINEYINSERWYE